MPAFRTIRFQRDAENPNLRLDLRFLQRERRSPGVDPTPDFFVAASAETRLPALDSLDRLPDHP
jgi:hypothetical protein